tara:strand:+ start:2391 stop:2621 length:231 start_codon:yes stop_codon:yes gene_type:complete
MTNYFSTAAVIAIVFAIVKFIEMRFVVKEAKPVKEVTRDVLVVYLSAVLGIFVLEQVDITDNAKTNTSVFVGTPEF